MVSFGLGCTRAPYLDPMPAVWEQELVQLSLVASAAEGGSQQLCKADIFIPTLKLREVKAPTQDHTAPKQQHHSGQAGNGVRRNHCERRALLTCAFTLMTKASTPEGQVAHGDTYRECPLRLY